MVDQIHIPGTYATNPYRGMTLDELTDAMAASNKQLRKSLAVEVAERRHKIMSENSAKPTTAIL